MAFYGYNGDVADSNCSPYTVNSSYEFHQDPESMNYYGYYSNSNQFDSDTSSIQSDQHYYSVYGQTETSTVIHYQHQTPSSPYVYDSFYPQTNFIINYSTLEEFNEPEFEEYDDTPYGGGYDIALTYGKPLPPSDQICYPRSNLQPGSTFTTPVGTISSPYGRTKPQQNGNGIIKPVDDLGHREDTNSKVKEDRVTVENPIEDGDRDSVDEDLSYDEGSDNQVPRYAYGSGLEAIDICDSLFGYWPCLEKRRQRYLPCNAMVYDQNQRDPWKSAADYLFEEQPRGMYRGHGYYFDGQHFDYSYD